MCTRQVVLPHIIANCGANFFSYLGMKRQRKKHQTIFLSTIVYKSNGRSRGAFGKDPPIFQSVLLKSFDKKNVHLTIKRKTQAVCKRLVLLTFRRLCAALKATMKLGDMCLRNSLLGDPQLYQVQKCSYCLRFGILSAVHLPRNLRPQFPRLCMAYCDLASSSESFLCLSRNDSTCHQISLLWIDPAVPALCRS